MATNTLLVTQKLVDQVVDAMGTNFSEELNFGKTINHYYEDEFGIRGAQIGQSIRMRKPIRVTTANGKVSTPQDYTQIEETFSIATQKNASFEFGSAQYGYSLGEIEKHVSGPTAYQLAIDTEADLISAALPFVGATIVAGSGMTQKDVFNAGSLMTTQSAPKQRYLLGNPFDIGFFKDTVKAQFNPVEATSRVNMDSAIGRWGGYDWTESNAMPTITVGSDVAGTVAAAVTVQGSTALSVAGFAANQVIAAGQTFTIVGVNNVYRSTRQSTGRLFQFVSTTTVTLDGAGAGILTVRPMYSTGGYKNMTALPSNGAVINLSGSAGVTYRQTLLFTENSFTMATLDLPSFTGRGAMTSSTTIDGYRLRVNMGSDVLQDDLINRVDILFGLAPMYEYQATKIWVPESVF